MNVHINKLEKGNFCKQLRIVSDEWTLQRDTKNKQRKNVLVNDNV